jgi:aspartate/methionine/tyrosine aminotransferase
MKIETFELERTQSLWENTVEYNLTETGIHPFTLEELLNHDEIEKLLSLRLGYGQTNGSIELREAICALYPDTTINNVLVTNGSIEANFVAMWSLLNPGDELVLMLPNYMQIWGIARSFGIKVKPYYLKEELGWQPDIEEVKKLVTPNTKVIAVCNPNNPTGGILSRSNMLEIIQLAKDVDAWIYADEIYRGAELSGIETPTFFGMYGKAIVAGGLSKAYALPGIRIGWLIGPLQNIADMWSRRDYTTIATSILSNRVASLALQPTMRMNILKRNRKILNENLGLLKKWADGHPGLFSFIAPQAGGMVFVKYTLNINSTELVTKLRKEKSTFIVAGDCFGIDRRVRIGIGSEHKYLMAGLNRISETLEKIK